MASFFFISCEEKPTGQGLKTGIWRGEISTQGQKIPFNFVISKEKKKFKIDLINGKETIGLDEVFLLDDTLSFNLHIFDAEIKAKVNDDKLSGYFIKNYSTDYKLPFTAEFNLKGRFDYSQSSNKFDGKWETVFTKKDSSKVRAIGLVQKNDSIINGTFLTATGDYRYLDGYSVKDTMFLYSFDGNHLYKFKIVSQNDSILKGEFWSGREGYRTFVSKKNINAKLPDPYSLTFLKEGYDKINFSFPNLDGELVSLSDEKYKGKVVIVQIFGTWCPNCMDETKFYSKWYEKNKDRGVEIIGLAYETKPDFDYAKSRVETMIKQLNVEYDFLIAGTSNNESASKSLPMLNQVISFPTSIIIDKKGKVQRIHTGFTGPATGEYYEEFVEDFNVFMNNLILE